VPKLPLPRSGSPLEIKGSKVEFSYFPTHKGTRRAGLHSKAYTTDAWSVIQASVRRIPKRELRANAVAFAEQARAFYSAAMAAPTSRARPLLLYYGFLNLAKTLCLLKRNSRVIGYAKHGLTVNASGRSLKTATLKAFPSKDKEVSIFDEFLAAIGEQRLKTEKIFRVHDLIACSLIGHRLWCGAEGRADRFLRLSRIEVMHDKESKKLWLRTAMQAGSRKRSGISSKDISKHGFAGKWKQIRAPEGNSSDWIWWEQKEPLEYTGRPSDKLDTLIAGARSLLYRSLTVAEPFRSYYVYIPPKRFRRHHQMAARYALLFFLGSITRYHPADFDDYLDSQFGPFISEFLASEPSQMLFEMASLCASREIVSVGLA
jgi:hypothetical protein